MLAGSASCTPASVYQPSHQQRCATAGAAGAAAELYGNEALYLFFRLYHFLFDRLHTLRAALLARAGAPKNTAGGGYAEPPPGSEAARTAAALTAEFLALVHGHVSGRVESGAFEDQCRAMLGAQSYIIFTVQKLVTKLLRSVQQILTVCPPSPAAQPRSCA